MDKMDMNQVDLKDFMEVLATCEGPVYMVTDDGDRLNLKSTLSQLIGFSQLVDGGRITHARLEVANEADANKLFRFNLFGPVGIVSK